MLDKTDTCGYSVVDLLKYLAHASNCTYISDLRNMDEIRREILLNELQKLPTSAASEAQWNEALGYIKGSHTYISADEARKELIAAVSGRKSRKRHKKYKETER